MAASRRHLSSALSHVARTLINSHVSPASPSPSPSSSSYGLSKPLLFLRQPWVLCHSFSNSFSSSPICPPGDSLQIRQFTNTAKTLGKRQKPGTGGETGKETGKGGQLGEGGKSGGGEGRGKGEVEEGVDPFNDTLPPQPIPSDFFSNPDSTTISVDDDDMESLLLNRDLKGIPGLPPPKELRAFDKSAEERAERREMERLKQEEILRSRVQVVDKFGRSYATGRRKCSVAKVWLKEGEGRVAVNNSSYDLYFPELEWRARLLQPFVVTETLGRFDVKATVTGGGRAGQAGAIRLGISRALQLYTPELRPPLKAAGFLTRDSRVVERKKPGKAKARKSFQWVKR